MVMTVPYDNFKAHYTPKPLKIQAKSMAASNSNFSREGTRRNAKKRGRGKQGRAKKYAGWRISFQSILSEIYKFTRTEDELEDELLYQQFSN
jgi:hypothetical protein